MTKKQEELVEQQIIMLDMRDVMKITGWCEQVVRNIFAYDKNFPAIKKGKKYQVESSAFKEYLRQRRVKNE